MPGKANLSEHIVTDPRSEKIGYIHAPWVKEAVQKLKNEKAKEFKSVDGFEAPDGTKFDFSEREKAIIRYIIEELEKEINEIMGPELIQ